MADLHTFKVVMRAESWAVFMPDEEMVVNTQTPWGPVQVKLRTRWENVGKEAPLPRELWIEVVGPAPSLDEAISAFSQLAAPFPSLIAFVTNIEVGMGKVHLAFDATPGIDERDFVEVFLPDERGVRLRIRSVEAEHLKAFMNGLDGAPERPRILRAVGHYGVALGYWFFGGESLSVGHLSIAAESLGKAMLRARCQREGIEEEELARSFGINPGQPRWRYDLDGRVRLEEIFHGDDETHRNAKEASDGLEHGYMAVAEVHRRARDATEKTFGHVRQAVLALLELDDEIRGEIMAKDAIDVRSTVRMLRGKFMGPGDELAAPGQEYPILRWESDVSRLWWKDPRKLSADFNERFTVSCAEGLAFQGHQFLVHGRLRPGEEPVDLGEVPVEQKDTDH